MTSGLGATFDDRPYGDNHGGFCDGGSEGSLELDEPAKHFLTYRGVKALRDAWDLDSADRAARVLERLAKSLEREHPGAAASIREGLDETLTVQRLGLTGALQRTLRTTNIIENLNGSVERYSRNVKRWRGGQMIQRWVASALVEAEKRFRRVRGYRDLQHLVRALDAISPPDSVVAYVA